MAAAYPLLAACEKKGTVATQASTSIRGISLDGAEIELEKAAIKELGNAMTGPVGYMPRRRFRARTKPAACRSGRWS
jgi:hypothetical protein